MTSSGPFDLDRREIEKVYARRAQQLAQRVTRTVSETVAMLVVGVGTERYAIELSALTEVLPYRGCTAVPGAPPALLGLINVRGDIKAVLDLRRILELQTESEGATAYVVMLRQANGAIGLGIETIQGVRQIDPSKLVSAAVGAASLSGSRYVKALTDDTVIVIDTKAVLTGLGLDRSSADLRRL